MEHRGIFSRLIRVVKWRHLREREPDRAAGRPSLFWSGGKSRCAGDWRAQEAAIITIRSPLCCPAMSSADFEQISHLTFDCYGTLIDWERGIISCLLPLLSSSGVNPQPVEILRHFVKHESALEAGPWQPYRDILKQVCRNIAEDFNVLLSDSECEKLPNSLADWQPFPDTISALEQLKRRFRLVILSNTDDDLFARTAARLVVPFDEVITAQQLRSYKPATAHFVDAPRTRRVPI